MAMFTEARVQLTTPLKLLSLITAKSQRDTSIPEWPSNNLKSFVLATLKTFTKIFL